MSTHRDSRRDGMHEIKLLQRAARKLQAEAQPLISLGRWEPDKHGPVGESYTALVDPAVGMALAYWLVAHAGSCVVSLHEPDDRALAVARAILREQP